MDNIGDPTSAVTPTSADAAFEQAMALHGENRLYEAVDGCTRPHCRWIPAMPARCATWDCCDCNRTARRTA